MASHACKLGRWLLALAALAALAPAGLARAYTLNGYTFSDGPSQTGKENIAVMVHGYTGAPDGWALAMENAIMDQLTLNNRIDRWDTWRYDWATDAAGSTLPPPDATLRSAQVHGQHLADWLIQQTAGGGYEHVHLMGHSLGGRVVETAAVKLRQAGLTLHSTFLDAYTPYAWEMVYGETAGYAEHYYNRDVFALETQDNYNNAHNIDVSADGGPGQFTITEGHSWPHEWYRRTVASGGNAPHGYGFALSKEFVGDAWQPPGNRPAGYRASLPGQGPPGSEAVRRRITRARDSYNSIVHAGDELTLQAGQTITLTFDTADVGLTNYLDFRFDFASRAAGSLTVSVDGLALTHVQEAFSLDGFEWSGKLPVGGELGPAEHTVVFSLAGGDSVMLDDISLGLYGDIASATFGDSDFDGDVDLDDLSILAAFYGNPYGMDWDRGDFDFDGDVDLNDLGVLASHYTAGSAQALADFELLTGVPEPAAGALVAFALLLAGRRRPRRRK